MSDFHPDMSLTKAAQGSKNSLAYGLLIMQNLSKKKNKIATGFLNWKLPPPMKQLPVIKITKQP